MYVMMMKKKKKKKKVYIHAYKQFTSNTGRSITSQFISLAYSFLAAVLFASVFVFFFSTFAKRTTQNKTQQINLVYYCCGYCCYSRAAVYPAL